MANSESLSTLRISSDAASATNLCSNVSSTQNIIDADELSGLTNLRTRPRNIGKILALLKALRSLIILISSPIILSPLLLHDKPEYNCLFCVILMSIFWMTEVLPLPITALLPIILFPLLGVLKAKAVAREYVSFKGFDRDSEFS